VVLGDEQNTVTLAQAPRGSSVGGEGNQEQIPGHGAQKLGGGTVVAKKKSQLPSTGRLKLWLSVARDLLKIIDL